MKVGAEFELSTDRGVLALPEIFYFNNWETRVIYELGVRPVRLDTKPLSFVICFHYPFFS